MCFSLHGKLEIFLFPLTPFKWCMSDVWLGLLRFIILLPPSQIVSKKKNQITLIKKTKTYSLRFKMSAALAKTICFKMSVVFSFQCNNNFFFSIVPSNYTLRTTSKVLLLKLTNS